jgi:hypothetical protein
VTRPYYERAHGGLSSYEADSSPPERPTESVIAESLDETVEAVEKWSIEKAVEFAADAVHPGLGRVINIGLKVMEVLSDAEAVMSPDSPSDLHVPLLHMPGGIEIDLNVHLPGRDAGSDGGPLLSGFALPGDDGLFGGWAIEKDRRRQDAEKETPRADLDRESILEELLALEKAQQADRARRLGPNPPAEITHHLSGSLPAVDPLARAVILRDAASQLRSELHDRPEFADRPILVVYDDRAGLGMWMVKPGLSVADAGRRIEIGWEAMTGLMTVRIG